MFLDSDLKEHLEKNGSIKTESLVIAEWNLNDYDTIKQYGNYRYRKTTASSPYALISSVYDSFDLEDAYTDATVSYVQSKNIINNANQLQIYKTREKNRELYFDLKECFNQFRPRSGINKVVWFESNKYIDNIRSATRPRYYLASKDDSFKYWCSYRKEDGEERGVSKSIDQTNIGYAIDDAAPFVIYNQSLPTNRVVVKMQTNLSESSIPASRTRDDRIINDVLADRNNSSIPKRWHIQYLNETNNWVDAVSFNEDSVRSDGSPIVDWNGYVELYYGLTIPEKFKTTFNFVDYISGANLPNRGIQGEAYVVDSNENQPGSLHIWDDSDQEWERYIVNYQFSLLETDDTKRIGLVRSLTDPDYYVNGSEIVYRDFAFIKGLRVVVETMYSSNSTFDLIEMSPRLTADITDYTTGYNFNKSIARDHGLPVGGLLASNGTIDLMNFDFSFSEQNVFENKKGSLVHNLLKPGVKFDFYEVMLDVKNYDKFIPIKTLYSETFPSISDDSADIQVTLRDAFYRLETQKSPSVFLQNITLTYAIAILLDNIGFSNYVFKGLSNSNDPVIPYFFVEPDLSVAEVLQRLAVATQSAMFFDEFNNFVVMSKEYMLPEEGQRVSDMTLYGQKNESYLPNIVDIQDGEKKIINAGNINYTTRYIQRAPSSLKQASYVDEDRTYRYNPVLLWEVAQDVAGKTINENAKSSTYALGAAALNTTLTSDIPKVENNILVNNIIDIGENVYWLPRFQGYLYSNGEIVKYDAVEYAVAGGANGLSKIWITNNQEYQKYFSNLPFNGKMYPTGFLRIFSEPYYEELSNNSASVVVRYKNGEVKSHGRGQFGTEVTEHNSGLSSYWSDNVNVRGSNMDSSYLFTTTPTKEISLPTKLTVNPASDSTIIPNPNSASVARQSSRNGVLVNFNRESLPTEDIRKTLQATVSGTVQSSALIFSGPNPIPTGFNAKDFVSYVPKELPSDFKHFGTRMRIIGKYETGINFQTPVNAIEYYAVQSQGAEQIASLSGGSGGIGVMINSNTNYGYYFEICSLTSDNLSNFNLKDEETGKEFSVLHNVLFYKIVPATKNGQTIQLPQKLWGGTAKILVDEGRFVGQDRLANTENPTVYDLSVEYEDVGTSRRFYLYLNGNNVAIVDDADPLPKYNNMALFVRGPSKCMFENVYALENLMSKEKARPVVQEVAASFVQDEIISSEVLNKYAISGFVKGSYLSSIGGQTSPKYGIYYDEFGTIFRECAYFNIKYDKAYPAFYAMLAPTFNNEKTYTTSGFYAGSYGAEFLIFNSTDKTIVLDETSGTFLRIVGLTFTQNTTNTLTVDDYYNKKSSFSNPEIINNIITNPERQDKIYSDILASRSKYGKREFSLDSLYIQDQDSANSLVGWIMSKTMRPRKEIGLELFPMPHLQLGDIVTIDYEMPNKDKFIDTTKQFVVAEMQYGRNENGPTQTVRVVEV
jgi:hypothetical protein